ncbi:MAG: type III pantothenate kinase [Bacteroidales bacterium]
MNLTIDIGNTRTKFAIVNNSDLVELYIKEDISAQVIQEIIKKYPSINKSILSTVRQIDTPIYTFLKSSFTHFIELTENTKLPIENLYKTKITLGKDRLAAVVGANNIFRNTNVLVIDMGTAITYDFINENNQFLGGNISPGLEMRYKALNHFTRQLPLIEKEDEFNLIGDSTKAAIVSGVQNGIIFEVDGYINELKNKFDDLITILTGGDANFFDKKLKNTIFVNSNLNFIGLNRILEYNL